MSPHVFFIKSILLFIYVYVFTCVRMCAWRPEMGVRCPGVGIPGGCEMPAVGAGTELESSGSFSLS